MSIRKNIDRDINELENFKKSHQNCKAVFYRYENKNGECIDDMDKETQYKYSRMCHNRFYKIFRIKYYDENEMNENIKNEKL